MLIGPNARHVADKNDYENARESAEDFCNKARRLVPNLNPADLRQGFTGLRPKVVPPGKKGQGDFTMARDASYPYVVHMIGIDSPGADSGGVARARSLPPRRRISFVGRPKTTLGLPLHIIYISTPSRPARSSDDDPFPNILDEGGFLMSYVLSFDQGTTSCRAFLFDQSTKVVASAQREFTQHYPQPGWVEHSATEIFETQYRVCTDALKQSGVNIDEIRALGITNQRETLVVWDRTTSKPIAPAIVWQCRRTASLCEEWKKREWEQKVQSRTGLLLDPYFSGTKLRWILDNVSGARQAAERGELAAGTIDSWLLWKLTGGQVHATDVTNASRTLLLNLDTGQWDQELLDLFEIPASILPRVLPTSTYFGETEESWFGRKIPILSMIGDQQSALFGQACWRPGQVKST